MIIKDALIAGRHEKMILKDALREELITEAEYWEGVGQAWLRYDVALEDARKKLEERVGHHATRKGDV